MQRLHISRARKREEKGDNIDSACRGYTDQVPQKEGKGDNKESGC